MKYDKFSFKYAIDKKGRRYLQKCCGQKTTYHENSEKPWSFCKRCKMPHRVISEEEKRKTWEIIQKVFGKNEPYEPSKISTKEVNQDKIEFEEIVFSEKIRPHQKI